MERDHDTATAKDDLDVEPKPGDLGSEDIHELAGQRRRRPLREVAQRKAREGVARIVVVQRQTEADQLLFRFEREVDGAQPSTPSDGFPSPSGSIQRRITARR